MVVWISGCCRYETTGVIPLLNKNGIAVRDFLAGNKLCSGDTLILCLSSAPLLGWYRYLKIVQWMAGRYDVQMIVLCPEVVYRSGVVRGRNVVAVNGESGIFLLAQVLTQSVQNFFQKGDEKDCQKDISSFSLKKVSETFLISPSSESDITRARKAYNQRSVMLQHLGFTSLLKLKVFMAGEGW